ncbi:hypothetical protein [Natrinema gari]|uniref:hypothetical protein n=1 Tax=Natrinema gari TaxID=419186 RepID=UPI001F4D20E6|nr:hypothetical protein [Natrinema gari]
MSATARYPNASIVGAVPVLLFFAVPPPGIAVLGGRLENVLFGLSLPLGFVGSGTGLLFVVIVAIGGFSLGLMGVDMFVYHGTYTRDARLERDGT